MGAGRGPSAGGRGLAIVVAAMAGIAMLYGYTGQLFSVVLEENGVSGALIGFSGASQMAGVFLVLPFLPRAIRRFGPARLMAAAAGAAMAAILAMSLVVDVWLWFPPRIAFGAAQSAMWTAGETWVNHASDDRARARTIGIFMSAVAAGYASGPFVLGWAGVAGQGPFLLAVAMAAGIAAPLLLRLGERIDSEGRPSVPLPRYLRLAPVPMFSNLAFGTIGSSLMALLAVYGLRQGMETAEAARMIGWTGWGGVFVPLLVAWLADRIDRTLLLASFTALSLAAVAGLPWALQAGWLFLPLYLMAFGGLRAGHYGLGMMLLGDRFRGADLPSATAVFGFMFGAGSVMGPALSGLAIDAWDPHGLIAALALFHLAYLPLPLAAWYRRRRAAR